MEGGAGEIDCRAMSQTADDVGMTHAIQRGRFVLKILNQGALEFGVLIALQHHVESFYYYRPKTLISRGAITRDINLGVAAATEAVFNVVTTIEPALQEFQLGHDSQNYFGAASVFSPSNSSSVRTAFCSAIAASCDGAFGFDFRAAAAAASFNSESSDNFPFDSVRRFASARSKACMASR